MRLPLFLFVFSNISFGLALDGAWKGPCEAASQGYTQDHLTLMDNNFARVTHHHPSAKCNSADIAIETSGEFAEGKIFSDDTAMPIQFIVGPTYMTPLTGGIAFQLNLAGVCGVKNWKAKQKVDVSGKKCNGEQIPKAGASRYDIYAIESDVLYLGKMTELKSGNSPENRPTELERNRPMKSVPTEIEYLF